eukprot:CAMPEP_0201698838 /NCGR_PEP_ID=MMETSP0578-20130828/21099_1 /ASSEMBLY_ACC=CAM_ASM_000663 /TAXON_ID=267565 /ORGANISM="Skeletonema grethea, Strain CCMP 1804" /LENGTH=819 /DNA_ID=CAMNT_0048185469 /DNA_START=186 /DNA_END=2645 /DNA_ORIENTATION=+
MIRLRVLTASTGACTHISLHPNELTYSTIRSRLAVVLPVNDQIILLGPPYKVPKDSMLRNNDTISALRLGDEEDELIQSGQCSLEPAERTGSKRLFLFSKRALANNAPEPPNCILDPAPGPLPMPTQADMPPPPPSPADVVETPLRNALELYVRQLMLDVAKGRVYADGADLRLAACRKCLSEMVAIAHALRAAVSNLSDHRAGAVRQRTQFNSDFLDAASFYMDLLQKFELRAGEGYVDDTNAFCGENESLGSMPLHPSLVAAARSSGRIMETLLDTVPLDREKAWANKCQIAHERLTASAEDLEAAFGTAVGTSSGWSEEAQEDLAAEDIIKMLVSEVDDVGNRIRSSQSEKNDILASNQSEATRIVSTAVRNESKEVGTESAFSSLEEMAKSSSSILITMESDDNILSQLSQRVADAKSAAMKRMKSRLRQISIAQSEIARVTSTVSVLQHALTQLKTDIGHLEHVVELPSSYQSFLTEIQRRRAYCNAFKSTFDATVEKLNLLRADEVKLREEFLRGPGKHLMPAFYEIFVPTLATSPAVFSPQLPDMLEFQTLPNVGYQSNQYNSSSTESASTLMTSQMKEMETNVDTKDQSALVSADENSGYYDVMMQSMSHGDAAPRRKDDKAERATLRYENAVLRQKLEQAGVKVPPYIDSNSTTIYPDENDSTDQRYKEQDRKISSLEAELERTRKDLEAARVASAQKEDVNIRRKSDQETTQQLSDKISHTSFEVGDIGLFMPTGRGRGGKRIYLAFHSSCPHRYLSPDCIDGSPDFVLGRIVYQEEFVAGALNTTRNPFGLHVGTKFWVLTVEVVKKG